jgi:hypothetical protein
MYDRLQAHGRIYELRPDAPGARAPEAATRVRFDDRHTALRFLRGLIGGDPARLRALRRTLGAHPGQSDPDVIEALAAALATSRLRAYAWPRARAGFLRPDLLETPPEPMFDPAPVAPVTEAPPPEAPSEFPEPAEQARVLRQAAQAGAPFCEECEKARKAKQSAPLVESEEVANLDAAAQAQALRDAARAGTPFCAECEKARRAQQSAPPPPAAVESEEVANVDAAAQATTLRAASAEGLPFCEECEKARRAMAKGPS